MQYITTTQLRTISNELIKVLQEGHSVDLIHRSKVIGKIKPISSYFATITDIDQFRKALRGARPKKIIPKSQRETTYRKLLEMKYGKVIS